MKVQKRAKITARCTESEYNEFLAFAKENGMNQTDLVLISIKEFMKSHNRLAQRPEYENGVMKSDYTLNVQKHLLLNKVFNIINRNPHLTDTVKEKLIKELNYFA